MLPIATLVFTGEIFKKEIICETSRGILGLLSGISEFNIPYITQLLEDLDIIKTIELVESIFNDNTSHDKLILLSPSQILSLNNLHEINLKIEKELKEIKTKVDESKNYWFKYLRTAPYHNNLENLKRFKNILDSRLDIALKLTTA